MREHDDLPGASAWPFERRCPECGKVFSGRCYDEWIYRDRGDVLCSWGCMRAREKKREEKKNMDSARKTRQLKPNQKEALIRVFVMRGLTNKEISAETGISMQLVNHYRKKMEEMTD